MKHVVTDSFWEAYGRLPLKIQKGLNNNFEVIKQYPRHPLLRLLNVGDFFSMRVDARYRAIAVQDNDTMIWFWVGKYAEYKNKFLLNL